MITTKGVKLDDQMTARLKALGKKMDRSPHWIMKKAIEKYVDEQERYERELAEDTAAYEEAKAGKNVISDEKVQAWLRQLADGKNIPWPS